MYIELIVNNTEGIEYKSVQRLLKEKGHQCQQSIIWVRFDFILFSIYSYPWLFSKRFDVYVEPTVLELSNTNQIHQSSIDNVTKTF